MLAYAGYIPAQDYLGWPPHKDPWKKRASNGAPLPGVVPFEVWLDNLKQLGCKLDFSQDLMSFDKSVQSAGALLYQGDRDLFTEIEENHKQLVCEKIMEHFNVVSD